MLHTQAASDCLVLTSAVVAKDVQQQMRDLQFRWQLFGGHAKPPPPPNICHATACVVDSNAKANRLRRRLQRKGKSPDGQGSSQQQLCHACFLDPFPVSHGALNLGNFGSLFGT